MNSYLQNLRYGVRMLRNAPAFSLVAVITLALGIGVTTAIFSIVNTVLLQPLPYAQPDRLMMVWGEKPNRGRERPFSAPDFEDFRKQNDVFADLSSFDEETYIVTGGVTPERIDGAGVSSGFFSILGLTPELGRAFVPADEQQSAAIVNRKTWRKWFGDSTSVEGKKITLDGKVYPVVGVAPDSFEFRSTGLSVWVTPGYSADMLKFRGAHFLGVVGRLKPGISASQAEAQMKTIASRLAQQYPDTDADTTVNLKPLREQVVGDVRLSLLVLLGAVCLVVLIACANVANLLLARATSRRKELAVRAALGASRARILAQLLTESVLLAVIGGALGLLIAFWGIAAVVRLWADQIPRAQDVHIDLTVMGFSLALSVFTGLVFGLAPALHTATPNLYEALKDAARSVGVSGRSQRLRHVLVVAELALAVVLVSGAGLLIRSFLRLQNVYPGFNPG